jgi:nucleotide-binding universal stress UspA family protein
MEIQMTGPVVVGLDGREAPRALLFARALARALNTEVVPVVAVDDTSAFPYGDRVLQESLRRRALATGRDFIREVARETGVAVGESRTILGEPAAVLRQVADELGAALVVVTPRSRRRIRSVLAPGITSRLARESPSPIVVVPARARVEAMRLLSDAPIVVGAYGSPSSRRAVAVAESLAERLELPVLPVGIDVEAAADVALRYRNVHPRRGQALVEIARRAGSALLVVGTRGGSWLSGSLTQRLIAATPVPLVVVPEATARA